MNPSQLLTLSLASPLEEMIFGSMIAKRKAARQFRQFGNTWTDQNQIFLNLPIEQLLAITAYGEAGNEGGEGIMAVLNVIRNRTADLGRFGDSEIYNLTNSAYHAVILKSKQFSMYNLDDPVRATAIRIASNFDSEMARLPNLRMAYDLADMLLQGQLDDNTGGADYYFNPYIVQPSWASSLTLMGQIGNHIFYKTPGSYYPPPVALASIIPELGEVDLSSIGVGKVPVTMMILVGLGLGLVIMKVIRR
jgi:hypothetical protein